MRTGLLTAAIAVAFISAGAARAGVIAGPTLGTPDGAYRISGLGFSALVNTTLTSFVFENQGLADVVDLVDTSGNVLDSVSTPAGTPSDMVNVNWTLTAGHQYYLLQTGTVANSLYATWGVAAPADAEIALTDTGVFSFSLLNSADFAFGGAGGQGTAFWVGFNNITTGVSATPEPGSAFLAMPLTMFILWHARRAMLTRRRQVCSRVSAS